MSDNAWYCVGCGAEVPDAKPATRCENCGMSSKTNRPKENR